MMNGGSRHSVWEPAATCARAAAGDPECLQAVLGSSALKRSALVLGVAPALAVLADRAEESDRVDSEWRRALHLGMTRWMAVRKAMTEVADVLSQAGVAWAPIKGADVCSRYYETPELRPTTDVDLLIRSEAFDSAREALRHAGWTGLVDSARAEAYLREEGYAWSATGPSPVLLEIHYRLWGLVDERLAGYLMECAQPTAGLQGECRIRHEHAYVLAAIHAWLRDPPRSLADWRDLDRIAEMDEEDLAARVVATARRFALQLPVCLSARVVAHLFQRGPHDSIAATLRAELGRSERALLGRLEAAGPNRVTTARVVLARLLAGRSSRAGWRSVGRRVWAHPGTVERATPAEWSWPRRRLAHLMSSLGPGS